MAVGGTLIPWAKLQNIAQPRVYKGELYDLDMCLGTLKELTVALEVEDADPIYFLLPNNLANPPVAGDIIEFPKSGEAQGHVAILGGDVNNPGTGFGAGAGFVDVGVFYSLPVIGTEATVDGLRVETSVPLPPGFATRAQNVCQAAFDNHGRPSVFITSKRPTFIPQVSMHGAVVAALDGDEMRFAVPTCPVREGDSVYIKRHDNTVIGPMAVTDRAFENPPGLESRVAVLVTPDEWPADFSGVGLTPDVVVIVSQDRASWNLEDIRRLKLVAPAQMTLMEGDTNWDTANMDNTHCNYLAARLHALFDGHASWAEANTVVPKRDHFRRVDFVTEIPDFYETHAHRLRVKNLEAEAAGLGPHDIIRPYNDWRYGYRQGRAEGFCLLNAGAEFPSFLSTVPNEHTEIWAPRVAPAGNDWTSRDITVICGVEQGAVLIYAGGNAIDANEIPTNINSVGVRVVDYEVNGQIDTTLVRGNRTLALQDPASGVGRPMNLFAHDYIRSDNQGQVDLCQHWHALLLTSSDLGVAPEQSNVPRSLAPIISSFLFPPTVSGYSSDKKGNVTGYSESPYGTITFNELGSRRYHALREIPGDLRSFVIAAEIAPRDNRLAPERVMLAPGESMSFQLMFIKNI